MQDLPTDGSERPADRDHPKMARIQNLVIGFTEENARCLHHLHDDALVVNICVGDYNTH